MIEQMVNEMGKRWAEIARRLRNRSDNAVQKLVERKHESTEAQCDAARPRYEGRRNSFAADTGSEAIEDHDGWR